MRILMRHCPPRGTTMLESLVALGVLAAAFTLGAQTLGWSTAQRRTIGQRHLALQEAANTLEQLRQLKWTELTEERMSRIELSPAAREQLDGAELEITPELMTDELASMRLQVRVHWFGAGGAPLRVTLNTWRYEVGRPEEAAP